MRTSIVRTCLECKESPCLLHIGEESTTDLELLGEIAESAGCKMT